jgi:hypothetical protein
MVNLAAINSGWIFFTENGETFDYLILCHGLSIHHDTEVDSQVGCVVRVHG